MLEPDHLWVLSAGFIYLGRFLHGKWRAMRVIEPEMVGAVEVASDARA